MRGRYSYEVRYTCNGGGGVAHARGDSEEDAKRQFLEEHPYNNYQVVSIRKTGD